MTRPTFPAQDVWAEEQAGRPSVAADAATVRDCVRPEKYATAYAALTRIVEKAEQAEAAEAERNVWEAITRAALAAPPVQGDTP